MAADFKVIRGSSVIAASSATLTLTDTVDYTLESGIASDAWFFKIASSAHTGMGQTSGGGNQEADDFMVSVSHSGNNTTLTRYGTTNDCRVDWEIIQYIGGSGGANEIKVRSKGTTSGTAQTLSVAIPGTVSNNSDLVPFITGQRSQSTRSYPGRGLATSVINGSNVDFKRSAALDDFTLSYAMVEFTGSNWTISNETFTNPATTTTEASVTLGTSVTAVAETFLHCTFRYETTGATGLDDCHTKVRLTSTTALGVESQTNTDNTLKNHSVWVIQNPDMTVTRYTGTMAGTGEEEVDDITITAVGAMDETLTTLQNDTTGTGTAQPRGFINHELTTTTNLRLRQSDNGQTSLYAIEIVELPQSTGTTHAATGALTGDAATASGTANRFRAFSASGSLSADGATTTGSANRTREHAATGGLTGAAATLSGAASRFRTFTATGALVGPSAAVSGTASRFRAFDASGALVGPASALSGSADHMGASTHVATGVLTGAGAGVRGHALLNEVTLDPESRFVSAFAKRFVA